MALSLTFKGFNYADYYNGAYSDANSLSDVENTGSDSIALTPDWGIDVANSSIYAGAATTDTVKNLDWAATIQGAAADGLSSFVRPLIDFLYPQASPTQANTYYAQPGYPYNPYSPANVPAGVTPATPPDTPTTNVIDYRGQLDPADINIASFFSSYDAMIVSEATAAQAAGATMFAIGTEMDSLADDTDPAVEKDWNTLISEVRQVFTGKLTYCANWATAAKVTFWSKLDYVGIDGYVPLSNVVPTSASQNPSVATLEAGWNTASNVQIAGAEGETVSNALGGLSAIDAFDKLAQQSIDKQFIFSEIGYQDDTGAASDPTGDSATGVSDSGLQANLYQALFSAWGAAQAQAAANGGKVDGQWYSLAGAYIWEWNPDETQDISHPGGWDNWDVYGLAAASVIQSAYTADAPTLVAHSYSAGVAGYEGEPTAARGSAGTSGTGALAGASAPGGASMTVVGVDGGAIGAFFATTYGSLELNANGSFTYWAGSGTNSLASAPTGAPAEDVVTYMVEDANGGIAESTLTFFDYRDPTAVAETAATVSGGSVSGTAGTSGTGVLAGDSDPDGVTLQAEVLSALDLPESNPVQGTYGVLTLNANGAYSYVADAPAALAAAFAADHDAPLNDRFIIVVAGGEGAYAVTTLTISISPQSTSPQSTPDDFYGNGTSDVLLREGGNIVEWKMLNGAISTIALVGFAPGYRLQPEGDFTGDGTTDILLQNTSSGALVDWLIGNGVVTGSNVVGGVPSGWSVVGTGDFTGDGTSDLLLQNGSSGQIVDWTVSNGVVTGGSAVGAAAGYAVVGTGDFTGDGTTDILLQSSSGVLVDWIIDNGAVTSSNVVGAVPTGFKVAGIGDFTGNGTSDILLQKSSTGALVDWVMTNGVVTGSALIGTAAGYSVVGTGDYNGDGTSDILLQSGGTVVDWSIANSTVTGAALIDFGVARGAVWDGGYTAKAAVADDFTGLGTSDILAQNSAGTLIDWIVGNGAITSGNNLGTEAGWSVAGTGDFNGDGTADLLLQNGGTIVDWSMKNGVVAGAAVIGNASGYTIVGAGDFTGDETSDILLQNSAGALVDWIMGTGAVTASNYLGTAAGYAVVGTGDFTGNGVSDILLENAGGTVVDWTMQNGVVSGGAVVGNAGGYKIVGTGDFSGNGTTDILLQNGAGDLVDWMMSNGAVVAAHNLGTAAGWTVSAIGDYTGNGVSDILLTNGGNAVDWTMANGVVSNATLIGNTAGFAVKH